jgi:hypothetical protein
MADPNSLILRGVTIGAGGSGYLDWGQACAFLWVRNGGTKTVYITTGAVPPTASPGTGRYGLLPNEVKVFFGTAIQQIAYAMAGTDSTILEGGAVPAGGG